jgi:hypothetical protein
MRCECIALTMILLLLLGLIIVLGDEAFATIEIPNTTQTEPTSDFTPVKNVSTPISLEQSAMSAPPSNISQQLQQQQPLPPPSNISQQQQPLPPPSNISQQQQPLPPPSNISQQQQPLPPPSSISQQLQLHLDEAIRALQAGDTAGAKVHLTEADKVIQEGAAKMHLDEAIKALESGDTAGAETHAQMAQDSQQQQQPLPPPSNISQQQQPLPPPSNISQQLQQLQQQPVLGQVMQQQQPGYQPPLAQRQQLSSIYQPPTSQVSPTIQQLPTQPLIQTPQTQSSLQGIPAQPYGIPSTTATIQPQLSTLPPTATTFPPSVLPPVNSLQPYGTTGGLGYPSTIGGQYGLGAAGAAATSVSTSSQLISPWFPSLPATYCGGTFLLTIEGTPRGNGDKDNKIEPSDNDDKEDNKNGDDNDDDGDRERRLLSLQVNSDNTRIFTDDDAISGEIFLGKNNIDKNKGNDFDIKSIFNDCQVVTFSQT